LPDVFLTLTNFCRIPKFQYAYLVLSDSTWCWCVLNPNFCRFPKFQYVYANLSDWIWWWWFV
jgi:hypothetical protein